MHPAIVQALGAEHIRSMTSAAEQDRVAQQARRARQQRARRLRRPAHRHPLHLPGLRHSRPAP